MASSFDTGPHRYITEDAARDAGFSPFGQSAMALENWIVDFYTNDVTIGEERHVLGRLHFDNLLTSNAVRMYWYRLANNTKIALQSAASANDPFRAICLLGMSLHAVQDFYTHSNWVELHPRQGRSYRSVSYFQDIPVDDWNILWTGKYPNDSGLNAGTENRYHGNYGYGMNHDSCVRPRYDEAYIFGYAASRNWIEAAKQWVESVRLGFFNTMTSYENSALDASLDEGLEYSRKISTWVVDGTNTPPYSTHANGKWNGEFSGSYWVFLQQSAAFKLSTSRFKETVTNDFWHRELAYRLDDVLSPPLPPTPIMPSVAMSGNVISVRTMFASDLTSGTMDPVYDIFWDSDLLADMFATVSIFGPDCIEATQQAQSVTFPSWHSLRVLATNQTTVPIFISLYDEDAAATPSYHARKEQMDITPSAEKGIFTQFNTANHALSGDVTGVFDGPGRLARSTGTDAYRGMIGFYVTENPLSTEAATTGFAGRLVANFIPLNEVAPSPMEFTVWNMNNEIVQLTNAPFNSNGEFSFSSNLPNGFYRVSVSPPGFLTRKSWSTMLGTFDAHQIRLDIVNGDVDGDNEVNLFDVAMLFLAFGSVEGDPNYIELTDLNRDLEVNLVDFAIMFESFGLFGDE